MRAEAKRESAGMEIVEMKAEDLDEVVEIERRSFPSPWSRELFLRELDNEISKIFLLKLRRGEHSIISGYICLWFATEEIHILNLAVHPDYRRQGLASCLLGRILDHYLSKGARYAILEVRERNASAISLYEKFGFKRIGLRIGYYSDTHEDAIVMCLKLQDWKGFGRRSS